MNRRGFFKSLALIASAASLSPTIFIPKFEPVRWRRSLVQPYEFVWFKSFESFGHSVAVYDRILLASVKPTETWLTMLDQSRPFPLEQSTSQG
jgi:hypothetical protein